MNRIPLTAANQSNDALSTLAADLALDPAVLEALLAAARARSGMLRRRGLFQAFDAILSESQA